ncbi:MAG: MATE family efflux transporter [Halobacteriales archaeon]
MAEPKESRVDMTSGTITPKLFHLAWPLVVGNLLQTAYNLADMFWVGRVGPNAVAAVSLMFPTTWLFVSVAMGITAAAVAVISQHIGAGEERQAENAVAQTTLLTLAVALSLATIGFAIRKPMVSLIGAQDIVYDLSLAYIEIIFVAIPFTFLFFVFRPRTGPVVRLRRRLPRLGGSWGGDRDTGLPHLRRGHRRLHPAQWWVGHPVAAA